MLGKTFFIGIQIALAPIALAETTEPERAETKAAESRDFVRDSAGQEGVRPGSPLRETAKRYRRRRKADTEKSLSKLPKSAGITEPRLDIGDEPVREEEKQRADATTSRIEPEVDPGVP